jgi:hypothetical protein
MLGDVDTVKLKLGGILLDAITASNDAIVETVRSAITKTAIAG